MTIEQVLMRAMKVTGGITQGRGISDAVLARWICTMPWSLRVKEAVEAFAEVTGEYSDQHVSLSTSWQKRDGNDLNTFVDWLKQHSPFNKSEELISLSSGVIAKEKVNCDSAMEIGENSVRSVIGKTFQNMILKRKSQVVTLSDIGRGIVVDQHTVVVNPNQLFHRIACVVRSEDDLKDCLRYELAPYPQSLFDNVGLRKGMKSKIVHIINKMCKLSSNVPENPYFVLDGGDLLHRVHWPRPATYGDVFNTCLEYINRHYGSSVVVVFDEYEPSTKGAMHVRRTIGKSVTKLEVTESNTVSTAQEHFLSSLENKSNFVKILSAALKKANISVLDATGDAYVLIIETAKSKAESGRATMVVGIDSDLLILIAGLTQIKENLYMLVPETPTTSRKIYSNRDLHEGLGNMKYYLLFIHAMMGCDTTSAFFNKGPITGFNKLQNDSELQAIVKIFSEPAASQDNIATAGKKISFEFLLDFI